MLKKILLFTILFILICLFVIPWLIPSGGAQKAAEIHAPFTESQTIDIYGTVIHYRHWEPTAMVSEQKAPVLLVHGFSGSTFSFRYMIPALRAQGHRVVAVDLPAFGYSDRDIQVHQLPDALLCLFLMLQHEATKPWIVMGHSMGASVVSDIAAAYPRVVSARVLIDGVPQLRPGNTGMGGIFTSAIFRRWANLLGKYFFFTPKRIQSLLASAYGPEVVPTTSDVNGYLEPLLLPGTAEAILKKFRYASAVQPKEVPENIPTLLIWGASDSWIPIRVGESYHQKHPNTQWTVISGAGHNPMETHPDACNAVILDFIANQNQ